MRRWEHLWGVRMNSNYYKFIFPFDFVKVFPFNPNISEFVWYEDFPYKEEEEGNLRFLDIGKVISSLPDNVQNVHLLKTKHNLKHFQKTFLISATVIQTIEGPWIEEKMVWQGSFQSGFN